MQRAGMFHPEPTPGADLKGQILSISKGETDRASLTARRVQLSAFETAEADAMKISGIRSSIVALPADEPLAGAAENPSGTRPIVTLEVQTDDGAVGVGATYFGGALTGTLRSAVEELGALCVGEDPVRVEAVTAKLRAAAGSAGPGGIFNLAHSALDMAL